MKLGIVVLAAGQGTRMNSTLPKVLHELAGKPLLGHVLDKAATLEPARIIVVHGHGGDQVQQAFAASELVWVEQAQQLGTGHALQKALSSLEGMDQVLVLYGDVPLTASDTLLALIQQTTSDLGLLTVTLDDPAGYGRIERDEAGNVLRIVEQKDATAEQLKITEINTGIMLIGVAKLRDWLGKLSSNNAQGEYYLTDVIEMAVADGVAIHITQPADPIEAEGVNDRKQMATLERWYQLHQAELLMVEGVSFADPARFDLRGTLNVGQDVRIDVNVIIEGDVTLGNNVSLGANTLLRDVVVGDNVQILENCVLDDARVGEGCKIGPFARLRPGTHLVGKAHVGNFVEIKNSHVALGSKINHLSYVGDTDMGSGVNIGAGTITCNYDGAYKHRTTIGDDVFVGSNSALVAPITLGDGSTIGAGSIITTDAPAEMLTVSRARQASIKGYKRPRKEHK